MTSDAHTSLAQKLATDGVVQLFTLDPTSLGFGMSVYTFTPGTLGDDPIIYQGVTYTPYPIQLTGLELTTQGTQPRPRLSISNIDGLVAGLVIAGQDLLGARLTRLRTFARFLDGQPAADPDAHWPEQTFIVDRKATHNKMQIEWELANPLDNKNLRLPSWLALKNTCFQRYRVWNTATEDFDYTRATCPYDGGSYWKANGTSTVTAAEDQCGLRLSDCRNRFGANASLPMAAFPGMRRL